MAASFGVVVSRPHDVRASQNGRFCRHFNEADEFDLESIEQENQFGRIQWIIDYEKNAHSEHSMRMRVRDSFRLPLRSQWYLKVNAFIWLNYTEFAFDEPHKRKWNKSHAHSHHVEQFINETAIDCHKNAQIED